MSALPPSLLPRKPSGVRVMISPGEQHPPGGSSSQGDGAGGSEVTPALNAQREVEILNHCFDDVERFMSRLQQTAEAQSVVDQRRKRSRKDKKTAQSRDDDLLTMKAFPPAEFEFVDIFQKIKYSLCFLHRLKPFISQPDAPELLHHIFVPLTLMVKTTGGPALGASVRTPAMTSGAVSLLREHLTEQEKELWTSLGPNWTSSRSHLSSPSPPPYAPAFLDGWRPPLYDSNGQPLEDPIELQHKRDAVADSRDAQTLRRDEHDGAGGAGDAHNSELLYCCSYDFVARNSSELSVLQGETLEVVESSKRWWKCRNRFGQVGFVPFNILEPLSAVAESERENPVVRRDTKRTPGIRPTKYFSYAPSSPVGIGPGASALPARPHSMALPSTAPGEGDDRVLIMNDELLQRLAGRKPSGHAAVVPRSAETTAPLNYQSSPAEVEAWLTAKAFSQQTIQSLAILTGAQLLSLNKEELRTVLPEEGARVYSQILVQKSILEDAHKATELEAAMQKRKRRVDQAPQSNAF